MSKQYRLKITWSNGDTEYFGRICNPTFDELIKAMEDLTEPGTFMLHEKEIIYLPHVRKVEYEEYIPEREVRI